MNVFLGSFYYCKLNETKCCITFSQIVCYIIIVYVLGFLVHREDIDQTRRVDHHHAVR